MTKTERKNASIKSQKLQAKSFHAKERAALARRDFLQSCLNAQGLKAREEMAQVIDGYLSLAEAQGKTVTLEEVRGNLEHRMIYIATTVFNETLHATSMTIPGRMEPDEEVI